MFLNLLFAIASFYVCWRCYKFLHGVKFPKDGQPPSALKTLMAGPVGILFFVSLWVGVMGFVALGKQPWPF